MCSCGFWGLRANFFPFLSYTEIQLQKRNYFSFSNSWIIWVVISIRIRRTSRSLDVQSPLIPRYYKSAFANKIWRASSGRVSSSGSSGSGSGNGWAGTCRAITAALCLLLFIFKANRLYWKEVTSSPICYNVCNLKRGEILCPCNGKKLSECKGKGKLKPTSLEASSFQCSIFNSN